MSGREPENGPMIVSGTVTTSIVVSQDPYRCPTCRGYFLKGNVSCCVMHMAGECCHYGDVPVDVTPEQAREIRRADLRRATR